jgi:hypothetical protein
LWIRYSALASSSCPIHNSARGGRALAKRSWSSSFPGTDTEPGEQTETELNRVVWCALFAKEFTKALTVAERAHALFPDDLSIETNRAHALMFMGHDEEAKALYLIHKGEVIKADNKLWEQIIAEDFAKRNSSACRRASGFKSSGNRHTRFNSDADAIMRALERMVLAVTCHGATLALGRLSW